MRKKDFLIYIFVVVPICFFIMINLERIPEISDNNKLFRVLLMALLFVGWILNGLIPEWFMVRELVKAGFSELRGEEFRPLRLSLKQMELFKGQSGIPFIYPHNSIFSLNLSLERYIVATAFERSRGFGVSWERLRMLAIVFKLKNKNDMSFKIIPADSLFHDFGFPHELDAEKFKINEQYTLYCQAGNKDKILNILTPEILCNGLHTEVYEDYLVMYKLGVDNLLKTSREILPVMEVFYDKNMQTL